MIVNAETNVFWMMLSMVFIGLCLVWLVVRLMYYHQQQFCMLHLKIAK